MWVWSLGQEHPLEKGTATHFSILGWRVPSTEEPSGLWSVGSQKVRHNWINLAAASWICRLLYFTRLWNFHPFFFSNQDWSIDFLALAHSLQDLSSPTGDWTPGHGSTKSLPFDYQGTPSIMSLGTFFSTVFFSPLILELWWHKNFFFFGGPIVLWDYKVYFLFDKIE